MTNPFGSFTAWLNHPSGNDVELVKEWRLVVAELREGIQTRFNALHPFERAFIRLHAPELFTEAQS